MAKRTKQYFLEKIKPGKDIEADVFQDLVESVPNISEAQNVTKTLAEAKSLIALMEDGSEVVVEASTIAGVERGTWIPVLNVGDSSDVALDTRTKGSYTKVGNLVYVDALIMVDDYQGKTGNLSIKGLPYPYIATDDDGWNFCPINVTASNDTFIGGYLGRGAIALTIKDSTRTNQATHSDLPIGANYINISATYKTN